MTGELENATEVGNIQEEREEGREVIATMESSMSIENLEYPDVPSTMAQLRECNIAHFACHGVSNLVDPSRSGLIL